jgi:uncharacterized protein (TIGR02001 family)
MLKNIIITGALLLTFLQTQSAVAQSFSSNIGFNSQYIYRGIPQKSSSVFGGMDFEKDGFGLGTWAADVGDGAEIDYYVSYGFEAGDFDLSIGGTWYTYTGDFDDEYLELNLGLTWKALTLDMASGQYENFGGPVLDYTFYSLSASHNGFYGKLGAFAADFDGDYIEAGYENTIHFSDTHTMDYGIALIYSDSSLLGGRSDSNFVLTLSKTFSQVDG